MLKADRIDSMLEFVYLRKRELPTKCKRLMNSLTVERTAPNEGGQSCNILADEILKSYQARRKGRTGKFWTMKKRVYV